MGFVLNAKNRLSDGGLVIDGDQNFAAMNNDLLLGNFAPLRSYLSAHAYSVPGKQHILIKCDTFAEGLTAGCVLMHRFNRTDTPVYLDRSVADCISSDLSDSGYSPEMLELVRKGVVYKNSPVIAAASQTLKPAEYKASGLVIVLMTDPSDEDERELDRYISAQADKEKFTTLDIRRVTMRSLYNCALLIHRKIYPFIDEALIRDRSDALAKRVMNSGCIIKGFADNMDTAAAIECAYLKYYMSLDTTGEIWDPAHFGDNEPDIFPAADIGTIMSSYEKYPF